MAKGVNGTIQINTQTIKQREQFGGTDGIFGVATDRLGTNSLFPNSPIALNSASTAMYQGAASGNGSSIQTDAADIYGVYANVIDPATDSGIIDGFGFGGQTTDNDVNYGKAYLNYSHPNNPFKLEDGSIDYDLLTKGTKHSTEKAYLGFPDLKAGDIDNPGLNQTRADIVTDLELTGDGASYGNSADEYRRQASQSSASASMLGTHLAAGEGNGNAETLGKYFRNNYTA